ncbi:MAG: hypothetical protein ACKVS6_03360 [Planctomycetota bacterium]
MKRGKASVLDRAWTRAQILKITRELHATIGAAVRRELDRYIKNGDYESAMAVHGQGAGDITYRIDAVADEAIYQFADRLGKIAPARILCEGPGEIVTGPNPSIRVLIDPIDGTRNVMADLRSAWVLTGFAEETSGQNLTIQDLKYSVQTEIPASGQIRYIELSAWRGAGCKKREFTKKTEFTIHKPASSRPSAWAAPKNLRLQSGYYSFLRYLPLERAAIGILETNFFARAEKLLKFEPDKIYDDQWLCAAGQLFLVSSGRMRMFADLRGWLAQKAGVKTVASHPYDLCSSLIATEAGSPVLAIDADLTFPPLDAPLDLETNVSFVAFANSTIKNKILPILRDTLELYGSEAADRLRRDSRC